MRCARCSSACWSPSRSPRSRAPGCSRRYVAELADFLLTSGARVMAFDLVLTAPTAPAEDQALLATVERWSAARPGSLLFATFAIPADKDGAGGYALLPPFSPELAGMQGFANAPIGADGMVRRFMPVLPAAGGGWLPALSLATLAASAGLPPEADDRGPLAMGIAVHTGPAFAGTLGAPRKKKYAVLGDTVNTTSRMEGLTRDLGTGILISGAVLAVLKDRVVVRDRAACR